LPLHSVEEIIKELEKDKSFSIKKSEYLTKYLQVGYDIHGRNWSRHLRYTNQRGRTEAQLAEDRGYSPSEKSNAKRNRFREKLLRMGAMYLSDSLYLLPLKVVRNEDGKELDIAGAEEFLKAWGEDEDVVLHVMGYTLDSKQSVAKMSKVFKKVLIDRFDEMEEHLEGAHKRLLDLADDVAEDPKKTIRGIHRIVEAIDDQAIDARELINRYSDDEDEERRYQFNLDKIMALRDKIAGTYKNIVEMKERQRE